MDLFFRGVNGRRGSIFFKGDPFACRVLGSAEPAAERGAAQRVAREWKQKFIENVKKFYSIPRH